MQTKERKKDRESLVALLVLTIEFRREERRETIFVPWNGSLSKVSLSLQKSPIAKSSRSPLQVLDNIQDPNVSVCVVS